MSGAARRAVWAGVAAFVVAVCGRAHAKVVDLRAAVAGETGLVHHYTFEGASTGQRLEDKAGAADLSVVSYGGGSTTVEAANGISFGGAAWDGTSATLTPYNDGAGFTSGGAGTSTVSAIALPSTMTVETVFQPLTTPNGEGYGIATRAAANQRGYYLYEDIGNRLPTVVGDNFTQADNNRTIVNPFVPGDWYYMANVYAQSGGSTTITSYIANLSQRETTLNKLLDGVVASGTYGTSAPLGVGLGDFTPAGFGYQRAYDGQIDEVAIYDRTVTQTELQGHLDELRAVNLTGRWTFDGNFNDSVGSNHGVATGATVTASGKVGSAASFDGNNDRVVIPQAAIPEAGFSMAFWDFSPDASNNQGYMVGAGPGSGFDDLFMRRFGNPATRYAGGITQDGTPGQTLGEPGPYDRGEWHHHVLTHDASGRSASSTPGTAFPSAA
ncbi:LamG-like jellyroll fold domain-containing protein, partial [Planctomycetota bacterium]